MTRCTVVPLTKGLEGSRGRYRALTYVCLAEYAWGTPSGDIQLSPFLSEPLVTEPPGACTPPLNHYTALHLDDSQISKKKKIGGVESKVSHNLK